MLCSRIRYIYCKIRNWKITMSHLNSPPGALHQPLSIYTNLYTHCSICYFELPFGFSLIFSDKAYWKLFLFPMAEAKRQWFFLLILCIKISSPRGLDITGCLSPLGEEGWVIDFGLYWFKQWHNKVYISWGLCY